MRLGLPLLMLAAASAVDAKNKKPNENHVPFDVKIASTEGTEVTVTITNKWKKDVNVFKRMTFLDPNPIQKVNVTGPDGEPAKFIGAHARVSTDGKLNKESFEQRGKQKSLNVTFDLAQLYDLSAGGKFEVSAEGGIPWAKKKETKLIGTAPFKTAKLVVEVDGQALRAKSRFASQKTVLQSDCTEGRLDISNRANAVCAMLSLVAADAAARGDAEQFFRYFRTKDQGVRDFVSRRYRAVADECAGRTAISTTYCSDALRLCQSDYISVTYGTKITNCDLYWRFPVLTNKCHSYDQATITIHETTHVDGVYEPSTGDFKNNYGWPALTYLTPEQAVTNGDNYQYYANAVYSGVNC